MPTQYTNIVFKGNSVNCTNTSGLTNANMYFCESSSNKGAIYTPYNVLFLDCSVNHNQVLAYGGCFASGSVNCGTLYGNFVFKSGSINYGIVPEGTCFEDGAINCPGGPINANIFYYRYNPIGGQEWCRPEHWYTDSSFTTQANQMPTSGSVVCLPYDCRSGHALIAYLDKWNTPSEIYSDIQLQPNGDPALYICGCSSPYSIFIKTLIGCAHLNGVIIKPDDYSCLSGYLELCSSTLCLSNKNQYIGNCIRFVQSAQNCGVLCSGIFEYCSKNRGTIDYGSFAYLGCNSCSGTVVCCATFSGYGVYNNGVVCGNASFYELAINCASGRICGTGCFYGTATNLGSVATCLTF